MNVFPAKLAVNHVVHGVGFDFLFLKLEVFNPPSNRVSGGTLEEPKSVSAERGERDLRLARGTRAARRAASQRRKSAPANGSNTKNSECLFDLYFLVTHYR